MKTNDKMALAVGAHPDDIELGCGGTLCKLVSNGIGVISLFATRGEKSGVAEIRMRESREALSILGVTEVYFGNFPDADIPNSHATIDFLEQFCLKNKPDIVFTHTTNDIHQDHRTIGMLSLSAFRNVPKLIAYETPRVTPTFAPNYFIDISDSINLKWTALKKHTSQKQKRYLTYESMINLASFRGSQVGVRQAEAFEVLKYLDNF
jgi:LmbE family N-acetylglucosaminyl deacetylase